MTSARALARLAPAAAVALAGAVLGLTTAGPATADPGRVRAEGELVRYAPTTDLIPVGATARVQAVYTAAGQTVVTLHVRGLLPDRGYGAHAHTASCGTTPGMSGGHYQRIPGLPTSPMFANPENEIWLDFTTDAEGNASAQTVVDWQFESDRRARSVVVHYHRTSTGPNDSGSAGSRLGCLTVPF